jgi:hypothetical protein
VPAISPIENRSGVALADQRRHQHAPSDDRDARRAGEHGEQRAGPDRDDREAARHPAERRVGEPHQPVRGARLGEQVARVDEQRDGRHHLDLIAQADVEHVLDHAVELRRELARQGHRAERCRAEHDREQRRAAHERDGEQDDEEGGHG